MPCAFDSQLAKRFDIYTTPYIIVVDPDGFVQIITYSISSSDIQDLLGGKLPRLPRVYRMHEEEIDNRIPYDAKKPFLINDNGGKDTVFLFRSVLAVFDAFEQHYSLPETITDDAKHGRFQALGAPLYRLYNYAYYGVLMPDSGYRNLPVLDVRDSTAFQFSSKYNKNLFCYSLILPPAQATQIHLQEMMCKDLENYFGYTATIEERKFPCWRLVATESAKKRVKTIGGPELFRFIIPKADFIAQNWPFSKFLHIMRIFNEKDIVDETNITGNIDIRMNCLLTDEKDVKRGLQIYGLDLIPGEKAMKVLVIRDKR
jgi:hypothetical protein